MKQSPEQKNQSILPTSKAPSSKCGRTLSEESDLSNEDWEAREQLWNERNDYLHLGYLDCERIASH